MASIEALDNAKAGGEAWTTYRETCAGTVDLRFADLNGADLRGRDFSHCDFSGAILDGANLDDCIFKSAVMAGTQLTNASLVRCQLQGITGHRVDLSRAVIRNSVFDTVTFEEAAMDDAAIEHCEFRTCRISRTQIDRGRLVDVTFKETTFRENATTGTTIDRCRFVECDTSGWSLDNGTMSHSSFTNSSVANLKVRGGSISTTEFRDCRIDAMVLQDCDVTHLDLSSSVVSNLDISTLGPQTAILLDTAFVNCEWPRQEGDVSWLGTYRPSPWLLQHPIQDIKGVPPTIRREAADAQYLTRIIARAAGRFERGLLRLWGATSAYGQSIGRLSAVSVAVIALHGLLLLASRRQLAGPELDLRLLTDALQTAAVDFLGLGAAAPDTASVAERLTVFSVRLCGFISLGFWITIASTKLNKLSAE